MTITATADAAYAPPRVEVDVAVPASNIMTAVNVWRNDSMGRSLVRSQPVPGFESRTVFDYECPYEQNVTYDWTASYYDPALNATTYSEPWTVFPGSWTGDTASASITSNRVTLTGSTSVNRSITRASLTATWDRITVARLIGDDSNSSFPPIRFNFVGGAITLGVNTLGNLQLMRSTTGIPVSGVNTGVPASGSFTLTKSGTTITLDNGTASYSWTATLTTLNSIVINAPALAVAENTTVGAITAQTFAAVNTLAETSLPVMLSPANAWLVAPQAPALSFPLSNTDQQAAGIRTLGPIRSATNTTVHRILGTDTPVTTTTGNRQSDELSATLYTHTSLERQALRALLAPDTPILINVPPSWDLELAYGFYQVGDVLESRPYTLAGIPMRDFDLPLTAVRSPEVDVENPGWSYAQLATTWPTYTDVLANYTTYADLLVDQRT